MEAIEIYTKLKAVTENQDTAEVMIALNFLHRAIEDIHYAKQSQEKSVAYAGSLLGAGSGGWATPSLAQQDPVAVLRNFIQQEIKAANTDETPKAEEEAA